MANAQTPDPTPDQVEMAKRVADLAAQQAKAADDRLKQAKAEAELADLADARRRSREKEERAAATERAALSMKMLEEQRASLPKSNVTLLEGKTELTGEHAEGRIHAQRSIARISADLARIAKAKGVKALLIVDQSASTSMWQHAAMSSQFARLNADYKAMLAPERHENLLAVETATAFVAAAAGLLALFRTDTKIDSKAATIGETALVSDLVFAMSGQDITVHYPALTLPTTEQLSGRSGIYAEVLQALGNREKAEAAIAAKDSRSDSLKALNAHAGRLVEQLYASDEKGQTLLAGILKAERFNELRKAEGMYLLAVKVEFANTSSRVKRNLFIFTGSRLSYAAGVGVSYFLLNSNGDIASARTIYDHSGFVASKNKAMASLLSNIGASVT